MDLIKPPRLRRGDVIGLVAPASPVLPPERIQTGVQYLEQLGYRIKPGRSLLARHGFWAGTDQERAADLNAMFRDPAVKAVFAVRGGYGSARLLRLVDYAAIRRHPKIFVGFSDLTALQLALLKRCRLVTFSGPQVAVEFAAGIDPFTEEQFWRVLTSARRIGPLPQPPAKPLAWLQAGHATGPLVAGNLALLTSLLGTPWLPNLRRTLLVLEDVGEYLHRLDRMFNQLRNARVLSQIAGLVTGQFTSCRALEPKAPHLPLEAILEDSAKEVRGPVAAGLAFGHIPCRLALPIGPQARLDSRRDCLEILESAVA